MENQKGHQEWDNENLMPGKTQHEVPEVAKNEPDDKPAGRTIPWTILIAVLVLVIIYFIFFY